MLGMQCVVCFLFFVFAVKFVFFAEFCLVATLHLKFEHLLKLKAAIMTSVFLAEVCSTMIVTIVEHDL